MVEDLAASYIALKLENEILQAQVQRLMEENAALQAQIPELQKSGAATENEPLQKPSEAQEPQQFPESPQPPAAGASQELPSIKDSWDPRAITEPRGPPETKESWEHPTITEPRGPPEIKKPREPPENKEPWGPPAITEHRVPPESKEFQGSPKFKVHWEPREIKEPREPSAIKESSEPPEIKESQELPEVNESWKPPVPLDPTAAWELQETAKAKKAHKSTGLQDLSAWKPPAAREPQEAQKPLEAPATQKPQASPVGYELPAVWKTRSPDTQGVPAVKKLQSSEPHDLANDEEPQKVSEYQAISSQLESLEHPVTQGPLEPWVPQEPLDPSDAKEFLELSAPEESLEGIIVVETGRASEFPQAHSELEAAPFPLEYPLAFNGDSQKLPKPLGQLNDYMRIRGHLYLTEAALVSFVASRILGEAGRWFQLLVDSQSPLLEQFERFMRVLQDTFDNPGNLEVVKHHLRQLGQRESLVHRYAAHLHFIAQELNLDESTLCIQFQEEFANSVQNELSRTSSANNLSDVIIQCIGLEEKRSGKADSSSSGPSLSEDRNGPESPPAENQPVQATNNRPHLSEAERARRREGHLCLYCGHPGHFARDCPVKPHRAQQAGNMEARR
ncbi:retrotransposon Gag-like protein 3 [Nannospalax galili]|uniref:retrotransposon Gag-like protein 3 n=1 Tax=Nannospalax galili TaxID=1026970 RepID=UPI00111C17BB|nr:retrotransposon Gag-like protein 3 [Nannospalax galili]